MKFKVKLSQLNLTVFCKVLLNVKIVHEVQGQIVTCECSHFEDGYFIILTHCVVTVNSEVGILWNGERCLYQDAVSELLFHILVSMRTLQN